MLLVQRELRPAQEDFPTRYKVETIVSWRSLTRVCPRGLILPVISQTGDQPGLVAKKQVIANRSARDGLIKLMGAMTQAVARLNVCVGSPCEDT